MLGSAGAGVADLKDEKLFFLFFHGINSWIANKESESGYSLPTAILEEEIYQKGKQENPIEYLKGNIRLHKTSK